MLTIPPTSGIKMARTPAGSHEPGRDALKGGFFMAWSKDCEGNWYCDCPACTGAVSVPSLVWDKNDNGGWFPARAGMGTPDTAPLPAWRPFSVAV